MHEPRFHCTKDYKKSGLDILPFLQLQSFTRFYINPMSPAHFKLTAPPPLNQLMPSFSLLLCIAFVIMAASVDPLVVGRVIGDVIDMFIPSVGMSVYYGSKHVTNGCDVKPSMATNPPKVTLTGNMDSLYTLVMTDPDAPSPSEPSMREWIHWIVADIPGGTNPNRGKEILPYMGPRPPVGIHRYILILFQQKGPLGLVEQPPARASFSTRYFARQLDLGLPVATVYFNSQKEPASRRR